MTDKQSMARQERLRHEQFQDDMDSEILERAPATSRMLCQVFDGGSIPTSVPAIFLTNPVFIDGSELEGQAGSLHTDVTRSIPVLAVGTNVPQAGDMLVAVQVGGKWVAQTRGAPVGLSCWPCTIPRKTLTLSWVNSMLGNGSASMSYRPPGQWSTGCVNQIIMAFDCLGGVTQFAVSYFISGSCPGGQSQTCQSPGGEGAFSLTLADYTCNPFHFHYKIVGAECPVLTGSGYTDFYVNE